MIGRKLRELRRERHLTQAELARKAGISTSYVSHIEADSRQPDVALLDRIATALDTRVATFFLEDDVGSQMQHMIRNGDVIGALKAINEVGQLIDEDGMPRVRLQQPVIPDPDSPLPPVISITVHSKALAGCEPAVSLGTRLMFRADMPGTIGHIVLVVLGTGECSVGVLSAVTERQIILRFRKGSRNLSIPFKKVHSILQLRGTVWFDDAPSSLGE